MLATPLAERMRPQMLEDFVGQEDVVGKESALRRSIDQGIIPSLILWGPPGVGKTTLARIIASKLNRPFYALSAVSSGVKDVRDVIDKAERSGFFGAGNALLFIDEIHRFSKSQQDSLLAAVEKGSITLIGATTENPSFEVNSALLSRCQVYVLKGLAQSDLDRIIDRAIDRDEYLSKIGLEINEREAFYKLSGGDARRLLNILEMVVAARPNSKFAIDNKFVTQVVQENPAIYDKGGEQHYDVISAFIKSVRGSDPNATVYWLARMLAGGEDPKFIGRRLIILASEDIGHANPTALVLANTCFDAVHKIGMPEARIILSQCATYLATSPKSNSAYKAIDEALKMVKNGGALPVPLHLRNAPTALMKDLDYGKDYQYSHSSPGNFSDQEFLPTEISGQKLFEPGQNPRENEIRVRLRAWWKEKYGY